MGAYLALVDPPPASLGLLGASLDLPEPVSATFTLKASPLPAAGEQAPEGGGGEKSRFVLLQHSFSVEAPSWGVAELLQPEDLTAGAGGLELEVSVSEGQLLSNLPGWEGAGVGTRGPVTDSPRALSPSAASSSSPLPPPPSKPASPRRRAVPLREQLPAALRLLLHSAKEAGLPELNEAELKALMGGLAEAAGSSEKRGSEADPRPRVSKEESRDLVLLLVSLATIERKEGSASPFIFLPTMLKEERDLSTEELEQGLQRVREAQSFLAVYQELLGAQQVSQMFEQLEAQEREEMEDLKQTLTPEELEAIEELDQLSKEVQASTGEITDILRDVVVTLVCGLLLVDSEWVTRWPSEVPALTAVGLCLLPAGVLAALQLADWRLRPNIETAAALKREGLREAQRGGWTEDVLPRMLLEGVENGASGPLQATLGLVAACTRTIATGCVLGVMLQLGLCPGWASSNGPLLGTPEESLGGLVQSQLALSAVAAPSTIGLLVASKLLSVELRNSEWQYQLMRVFVLDSADPAPKLFGAYTEALTGEPQEVDMEVTNVSMSELLAGQSEILEPPRPNSEFSRARALRRMGPYKLFGFLSSLGSVPPNWFSSILPDIHTPSGELQANAVKASLLGYWGIRTQGWLEVAWTGYASAVLCSTHSLALPLVSSVLVWGQTNFMRALRQPQSDVSTGKGGGE